MATPDDVESRLTAVEREVARLNERQALIATDAAAARTLASGADRDVSEVRAELRAHTSALNALRETQLEQGRRLDRLEQVTSEGFATVDQNFANVEQSFANVEQSFETVREGLTQIVQLLDREG